LIRQRDDLERKIDALTAKHAAAKAGIASTDASVTTDAASSGPPRDPQQRG
jgi:hypothetical protein